MMNSFTSSDRRTMQKFLKHGQSCISGSMSSSSRSTRASTDLQSLSKQRSPSMDSLTPSVNSIQEEGQGESWGYFVDVWWMLGGNSSLNPYFPRKLFLKARFFRSPVRASWSALRSKTQIAQFSRVQGRGWAIHTLEKQTSDVQKWDFLASTFVERWEQVFCPIK